MPAAIGVAVAWMIQAAVAARAEPIAPRRDPRDSLAVLRAAKNAQAEFEHVRRANLPRVLGGAGGSDRCEQRIGRFCYWYDPDELPKVEEPARTVRARDKLLERLDSAAARVPGDDWIVGQRVRYLIEAGRADAALRAADDCAATPWWCAAMRGFARHAAQDFAGAEGAFAEALNAMPRDQRCRWTDISALLEGPIADRYRHLACEQRADIERRFWALARPQHVLPGNDVLTEHFARVAMTVMLERARTPEAMSWGDDSRELIIRYGWPTRWATDFPSVASPTTMTVIGYERTPSFTFLPRSAAVESPMRAGADDWELRQSLARARYSIPYATRFESLDQQLALFRRGDSSLVVAAFELAPDTAARRDSVASDSTDAALVLTGPSEADTVVARSGVRGRTGVLRARMAWDSVLVSVEALDRAGKRAARARFAVATPRTAGPLALSDVLLYAGGGAPATTLDSALARAVGSTRVATGTQLGLYWELYEAAPDTSQVAYTVSVTRTDEPWYRRAAQAVGIAGARAPVRLAWRESPVARDGIAARALTLDISALRPGRYRLEILAERGEGVQASTGRVIEIVER